MYQSNVSLLIKNYNILSTGSCQYIGFTIYDQAVCFVVNLFVFFLFHFYLLQRPHFTYYVYSIENTNLNLKLFHV